MRFAVFFAVIASLFALPVHQANASRVSPMSVSLDTYGRGSVARIQFTNTADRDFPIEIRAYRGEISEDGELTLIPADDDFLIFPPQLVVPPNEEQVLRIQYVGEPALDQARVYYVSVRELPIELEQGTPQIQVTVRYNIFVSVEPQGLDEVARVDAIESEVREEETGISVRVVNEGDGMLLAGKKAWTLRGQTRDGAPFEQNFSAAEMSVTIGVGVVAPDRARRFFIPLDPAVDPASLRIELD